MVKILENVIFLPGHNSSGFSHTRFENKSKSQDSKVYLKDNRQGPEGEVGMPVMLVPEEETGMGVMLGAEEAVGMVVNLGVEEEAGMVVMLKVEGEVGMFVKDIQREDMSGDSQLEVEKEGKRMMVNRLCKEMVQSNWWQEGKEVQSRRWWLPGKEPLAVVGGQYHTSKSEKGLNWVLHMMALMVQVLWLFSATGRELMNIYFWLHGLFLIHSSKFTGNK